MYDQLSNEEKMLVNSEVANNKKSVGVSYLLWFFLSSLGIHRMYLGRKFSGAMLLILTILGWLTFAILIGWVFLAVVAIWVLVDAFLLPGIVKAANDDLTEEFARKILASKA